MKLLLLLSSNSHMTRRLFIVGGFLSGLGSLYLILRGMASFLEEPVPQSKPSRFPVIKIKALSKTESGPILRQGLWLIKDDQGWYGLINSCTHLGCQPILNPEKRNLICPCHGSRFNLKGEVLKGPANRPLTRPYLWKGPKEDLWVDLGRSVDFNFRVTT